MGTDIGIQSGIQSLEQHIGKESEMNGNVLRYCEAHGIYEVYKERGDVITYYSYFGSEGFYKVTVDTTTGKETRKHLRYKKAPKFLLGEHGVRYNYFVG